ncbi:C45 family autoproteolytic acyltransferase/hydolase [Anaerocolumna sp. MB42-C2]|uniref:C45 family autoproteolytic acyltransferase/hydolase n=1 Tax=Anaerocolumna sp. MB42-C2 TaxID=3070997 RepID=UPI0027DECDB8|nr:C45 family peptidase [Anaerocolumna sp. MB42-C2]WMJ86870.1 C45 family peptidase [Anaerocolumna sp. MB42-C2]
MNNDIECYMANSYCFRENGWTFLHIEGAPYERGFQHGYHLAKDISKVFKNLAAITFLNTGKEIEYFIEAAHTLFSPSIDSEFIEELRGIADGVSAAGCKISFDALVVMNGYIELIYYWWPSVKDSRISWVKDKTEHCSAFIAAGDATKDNEIVMGHNTWWDFFLAQYFYVILDIIPTDGYRVMMQCIPGFIHSMSDFFITGAGIMGTATTINGFNKYKEGGVPEFSRVRKAKQYGSTIDEWARIMEKENNGGIANSWLLGDINTKEIARFELGLVYSSLDKLKNGFFTGFNEAEDPRIRNLECENTEYNDIRGNGSRKVRWKQLMEMNYGKIDIENAEFMLEDHYDIYLGIYQPGNRTICGHWDVDPFEFTGMTGNKPYNPGGAVDGKVVSSSYAKDFSFWARYGRSCCEPFYVDEFLKKHPQWEWQREFLLDRPTQPWTLVRGNKCTKSPGYKI